MIAKNRGSGRPPRPLALAHPVPPPSLKPASFFLFSESIFYFTAGISVLPWPISFLPRAFFFSREDLSFAAIIFLLSRKFLFWREIFSFSRPISFLRREFFFCHKFSSFILTYSFLSRASFFCRGNFSFVGSFFLLPQHLWDTVITTYDDGNLTVPNTHCVKSVRIGSFSGPYFSTFGLNMEGYGISLRFQSKCGKIWTKITPNKATFHRVIFMKVIHL